MNEEHWAAVILGTVILTVLGLMAFVVKSGWVDRFIQ